MSLVVGCVGHDGKEVTGSGPPAKASEAVKGLRLSLSVPARARAGEVLKCRITLTNQSLQTVRFDAPAYPAPVGADVVLRDATGQLVWQRRQGVLPALAKAFTLQPGTGLTVDCSWDGRTLSGEPVKPGTYDLFASLRITKHGITELLRTDPHTLTFV